MPALSHSLLRFVAVLFGCLAFAAQSAAIAAPTFQFQGRVRNNVNPVNGTGYMQFALLHKTDAEAVYLWNSSDGPSTNAPDASVEVPVDNGYFNAVIGDVSVAGMAPLSPTFFNDASPLYLRVWFAATPDGPAELLEPDFRLSALAYLGEDGDTSTTIHVDGATGNDLNSGLLPGSPKKTISSAVRVVPKSLKADYSIVVAPGLYPEAVRVSSVQALAPNRLRILGDTSWAPELGYLSGSIPTVMVSGYTAGTSGPRVRVPLTIEGCAGLHVSGFGFIGSSANGLFMDRSSTTSIERCAFSDSHESGVYATNSSSALRDVYSFNNEFAGINLADSTVNFGYVGSGGIIRCSYNNTVGVAVSSGSFLQWGGTGQMDHNTNGVGVAGNSAVMFLSPDDFSFSTYTGTISDNSVFALVVEHRSFVRGFTLNTRTGNAVGDYVLRHGSTLQ